MRVALFSDVHGNLPALERVLAAVRGEVDAYVCLGDTVNYGPWSTECLELVSDLPHCTQLIGNHERMFTGEESIEEELPLVRRFWEQCRPQFHREDLLAALLPACRLGPYACAHTLEERKIYINTAVQLSTASAIGHSHQQYLRNLDGVPLLNPGSVGQNRSGLGLAQYAVLDFAGREPGFDGYPEPLPKAELRSLEYDPAPVLAELERRRYPEECLAYYRKMAAASPKPT